MDSSGQYLTLLAAGLGTFVLAELLLFAASRWIRDFRVSMLSHLFAVFLGVTVAVYLSGVDFSATGAKILLSAVLLLSAWEAFDLFDALVLKAGRLRRNGQRLPALVSEVVRILFMLAVLLRVLHFNDVPLQTVLVSSTVLSAVLGLALQDVLRNVFAGMAMQIEGVPKQGEWLEVDGRPARVEEMRWRTTRLRTNEGIEVIEPNGALSQQRLVSYGTTLTPRAFEFTVGLPYGVSPAESKDALVTACRSCQYVVSEPEPLAMLDSYGDSSIVYRVRAWTHLVNRRAVFIDAVNTRIWYELKRRGISIPFPIRDVLHRDSLVLDENEGAEEHARRLRALTDLDLLRDIGGDVLAALARSSRLLLFHDGEELVCEGDPGDSLMVLTRGRVVVQTGMRGDGSALQLAELSRGDFFGEMSLLTGEPRQASVVSQGECEVVCISKADLEPLFEEDPNAVSSLAVALAERAMANQEARERHQERLRVRRHLGSQEQAKLLDRIREFFRSKA